MKLKFRRRKQFTEAEVYPVVFQPVMDVAKNGLYAFYYGRREYCDVQKYRQEVSLVFRNEVFSRSRLINRLYEWLRILIYGRRVDIETFYCHVEHGQVVGLSFPGIYSGASMWKETAHGDRQIPPPIHPVQEYLSGLLKYDPVVYVNTWNHALAPHDNNPHLDKTLYHPFSDIKTSYATRVQVERKYRNVSRKGAQ